MFLLTDKQTFLGFEMTPNSRDTSPLKECSGGIKWEAGCAFILHWVNEI